MVEARFDVAVVGAGPAGIAAATAAAEAGRRVVVLDETPRPGGQIWRHLEGTAPSPARPWLQRLERSGAMVVPGAAVVDVERDWTEGERAGFTITAQVEGKARLVASGALVVATGARERFLPFPGWTLPNVVGVGGAQALLKAGTSFAGKRVVVAGSGPLLLPVSAALARAGARVLLVAEQAPRARVAAFAAGLWREPRKLAQAVGYRLAATSSPYRTHSWVVRATGDDRLRRVEVRSGRRMRTLACDILCTGFGLVPNLVLPRLLGCGVEGGVVGVDRLQRTTVDGVWCAGEGTGIAGVEASLAEGSIAGYAAAGRPELAEHQVKARDDGRAFAVRLREAFALRAELRALADARTVVCRCEDVVMGELRGESDARQAKLRTRIGMGPCQGRVCGPAAEYLLGWNFEGGRVPVSAATIDTLARGGDE